MPIEEIKDWSCVNHEGYHPGDDTVFKCRQPDGTERWFWLYDYFFRQILNVTTEKFKPQGDGLIAAYLELGGEIGYFGESPWVAPDFQQVIRDLNSVPDTTLKELDDGRKLVGARRDLVRFLSRRCLGGDTLIVDDETGTTNRWPQAEPGWTETGLPLSDSVLIFYTPASDEPGGYTTTKVRISTATLSQIANSTKGDKKLRSLISDFLASEYRPYRIVPDVRELMGAITSSSTVNLDLVSKLENACTKGWPIVLQSAGRFPVVPPTEY
ncbi:hypothetical protein [Microbulbifer pacificus]|uniref:Uncharacterized protein n=1 Tax=Microbulbifer pacificus TaxID=407164 RepID=A0AAU0MX67_9GAMM|nr:hypothetical protein [Microbulbifer pacificus]WOX04636.1 hypothetical protein R5R33_12905 [Microbulbifer pacificus]